ncbi:RsfA family transcriptional regulator [Metabacillus fastidiosus]|uniref:RsfA family transcriptional regulator n=1 Tax=Metabacillus fastidiosus TaxID=1458 RepID=UPI003D2BB828
MKVRHDAWSHEDDLLLVETVLRFIREGSTQIAAFEEVGEKLNRTAAACGFRWNAEIRQHYTEAIEIAKKRRREKKREENKEKKSSAKHKVTADDNNDISSLTFEDCIAFLQNMKEANDGGQAQSIKTDHLLLQKRNEELLKENKELQKKYEKLKNAHQSIEEDYKILVKIIDEARKNIILGDDNKDGNNLVN